MKQYYGLLQDILDNGVPSDDRTGVGTIEVFGRQLRFELSKGFPLLTGKYTSFKLIEAELIWFLRGSTNNEELRELSGNPEHTIWEDWSLPDGNLGAIYGRQWRSWEGYNGFVDQVDVLLENLTTKPYSRRHIVSAWNVDDLPDESITPQQNVVQGRMSLAPCHYTFQMNVQKRVDGFQYLSCMVNIRSSDTFLGLPFNIASYALLTHIFAGIVGMQVGDLVVSIGSAHLYNNQIEPAKKLLARDSGLYPLPVLKCNSENVGVDSIAIGDYYVDGYDSYPPILVKVAV